MVRFRRFVAGAVAVTLLASGLAVMTAAEASAASTSVTNVRWTKPRLDVALKDRSSTLRVHLADRDGVCGAAVRVVGKRYSFTRTLYLTDGSTESGTWSAKDTWYFGDRGTWRVTIVSVVDCEGTSYLRTSSRGIGSKLKVYSSKPITKLRLSSVPGSLLRGTRDTATVKATAGKKKVKRGTVRLIACDDDSYRNCWLLGKKKTSGKGIAQIKYKMPRKDVVVYAAFRGSSKASRGFSSDRSVNVRWLDVKVGLTITVSPGTAYSYEGSGTATVWFSRTVCDATVELVGDITDYDYVDGCASSITFSLSEYNFESYPVTMRFSATLASEGYDEADSYTGRSGLASFTVPAFDF